VCARRIWLGKMNIHLDITGRSIVLIIVWQDTRKLLNTRKHLVSVVTVPLYEKGGGY
jgi:hypothetical protein